MPLSDREQQILHEIERKLLEEDPTLGDIARESPPRAKQIKGGVFVFLLGLVLLVLFFVTSVIVVGLGAFALMVGGVVLVSGGVREILQKNFRDFGARQRVNELFSGWEKHFKDRRDRS